MAQKLTDTMVRKDLPVPDQPGKGGKVTSKITYDTEVKGFGVRVTPAGARAFVLNYRTRAGRERRYTIGDCNDWKTSAARDEARNLKRQIDVGHDPMAKVEADRNAKTVADLCKRFEEEHLPKCREATQRDYRALLEREILPALKHSKVAELAFTDINDLHRKITKRGAPYVANRTMAVISKMLSLAIKWGWRTDNPARGIERNPEKKRDRYLSTAELGKLTDALASADDQQGANIIRLLLLTGARKGEVLAMKWGDLDLTAGAWTKPGSTTKQKTLHRVPLSAPARQLLSQIHAEAEKRAEDPKQPRPKSEFVFPGRSAGHRDDIKKTWRLVCEEAGIVTISTVKDAKGSERTVVKPSARIHDLRHTHASVLVSAGLSLPIIGALLGHSQPATTARYAHLADDPLRAATERFGAIVMPSNEGADVVPIKGAT
ncbi:site-specific integrase [Citromicrobium bathyomarinum]